MLSDDNQEELQTLLEGKSITKQLNKQISLDQIHQDQDAFYSLLVFTGYLNPQLVSDDPEEPRYSLTIPNRELRTIYRQRVKQ